MSADSIMSLSPLVRPHGLRTRREGWQDKTKEVRRPVPRNRSWSSTQTGWGNSAVQSAWQKVGTVEFKGHERDGTEQGTAGAKV